MEKYSVASSNVKALGYDPQSETLEVDFLNGSRYQYYGVPQQMYERLMQTSSKGRFLHVYIKNSYAYSRVA